MQKNKRVGNRAKRFKEVKTISKNKKAKRMKNQKK